MNRVMNILGNTFPGNIAREIYSSPVTVAGEVKGDFRFVYFKNRPEISLYSPDATSHYSCYIGNFDKYLEILSVPIGGEDLIVKKAIIKKIAEQKENLGILLFTPKGLKNPFSFALGKGELDEVIESATKIAVYNLKSEFFSDYSEVLERDAKILSPEAFVEIFSLFREKGEKKVAAENKIYIRNRPSGFKKPQDFLGLEVKEQANSSLPEGYYLTCLEIGMAEFAIPLYGVGLYRLQGGLRGVAVLGAYTTNTDWYDERTVCTGDEPSDSLPGLKTTTGAYYGSVYDGSRCYQPAINYISGLIMKNIILKIYFKEV